MPFESILDFYNQVLLVVYYTEKQRTSPRILSPEHGVNLDFSDRDDLYVAYVNIKVLIFPSFLTSPDSASSLRGNHWDTSFHHNTFLAFVTGHEFIMGKAATIGSAVFLAIGGVYRFFSYFVKLEG